LNKQSRDGNITWSWEGDTFALRGFNVAITPYGGNPNSESIAKARVEASSRSYTFENITINIDGEYQGWVQAIYEGGDSAWQTTGKITVPDDGTPTIVSSTDGDTIADETEQNAKEYFDSRYIKDNDELIHFDEHLTSTNGMAPDNDYTVTLRDDGKFKGGVAVEEATENLSSGIGGMSGIDLTYLGNEYGWEKYAISGTWDNGTYPYCMRINRASFIAGKEYSTTATLKTNVPEKFNSGFNSINYVNMSLISSGKSTKKILNDGSTLLKREGFIYPENTSQLGYISMRPKENGTTFNPETDFLYAKNIQVEQKKFCTSFTEAARPKGKLKYNINTENKTINFQRKGITSIVENTDEDFSKGVLTDVEVVGDGVELAKNRKFNMTTAGGINFKNDIIELNSPDVITIEAIVNISSVNRPPWSRFISVYDEDVGSFHMPDLTISDTGSIGINFGPLGIGWTSIGGGISFNTDTHLAFTFKNTGEVIVYKNDIEIYRNTFSSGTLPSNISFVLGNRYDYNGEAVEGSIRNLRFWDIPYSEINLDINKYALINENGLIASYPINDGNSNIEPSIGSLIGITNGGEWVNISNEKLNTGIRQSPQLNLSDINNVTGSLIEWEGLSDFAIEFDGIDGQIETPSINIGTNKWSVETWVYPKQSNGYTHLFTSSATQSYFACKMGALNPYFHKSTHGSFNAVSNIGINEWSHLAFVYTGAEIKIYINGNLDVTHSVAGLDIPDTGFFIQGGHNEFTNAIHDDIRLWVGKAKTEFEIKKDMNTILSGTEDFLELYYKMDKVEASSVIDVTGKNDGSLIGGYSKVEGFKYNINIETSVDGGTSWDKCLNGEPIPNLPADPDTLDIRQVFNTTDTTITPTLSEIKAYIFTDSDDEYKMYTIKPDGTAYLNGNQINAVPNAVIDITEPGKLQFKPNNIYDELLIKDGDVTEEEINNWYELGKPFEDNDQKFNTSTPTNVILTEVND